MAVVLTAEGKQYRVRRQGLRIGRGPGNDIALADQQVSRHHARIWVQGERPYIRDTGSRNGTFVNGARITKPQSLQQGDQVRVGSTTLVLDTARRPAMASGLSPVLVLLLIAGAVLVVGTVVAVLAAPRSAWAPPAGVRPPEIIESRTPTTPPTPWMDAVERARLATVLVVGLDGFGEETTSGSGSVVDPTGYILTNYHVVEDADALVIFVNTGDQNAPPRATYQAETVEWNADLDLALLQVTSWEDGRLLSSPVNLTGVPLGDSDTLQIGDAVTIMGFPEVGGETLTLTRGTVAGFHEDSLGHNRGWIKTDAEISPGNSGGVAINEAGELIGVPTFVSAEARTLGRIGGLRPINLAMPLLGGIP